MSNSTINRSIQFFESQFKRQIETGEFTLNPFEEAVLPYVRGSVLDLGCGLGNLSVAAARRGSRVLALDGSDSAVEAIRRRARSEGLPITAEVRDLASCKMTGDFDTVLCIGLLMFFAPALAIAWLDRIKMLTRPHGIAAVNVLIEGTTYLDMFDQKSYTLFAECALHDAFADWKIEYSSIQEFDAPGSTIKRFSTIVARKLQP